MSWCFRLSFAQRSRSERWLPALDQRPRTRREVNLVKRLLPCRWRCDASQRQIRACATGRAASREEKGGPGRGADPRGQQTINTRRKATVAYPVIKRLFDPSVMRYEPSKGIAKPRVDVIKRASKRRICGFRNCGSTMERSGMGWSS